MNQRCARRRARARPRALLAVLGAAAVWIGCAAAPAPGPFAGAGSAPARPIVLELLGEAVVAAGFGADSAPVGGLSGIAYDAGRDLYYAISDDPADRGPARFYTLVVDLGNGALDAGDVAVRAATELLDRDGAPFAAMTLDCEGIALTPAGTLLVSSEGQADRGVDPFLREARLDGSFVRAFAVPGPFLPRAAKNRGIRHNLGFESLAVSPDGRWFYTSTENALLQDGPPTDVDVSSPARILRYELPSGRLASEYVYQVEPVTAAPPNPGDFRTRGLVELAVLDDGRLLALERSYAQGVGNAIDLFAVSLAGATDVHRRRALAPGSYRPVAKTPLLEFARLGLELDNIEGMTLGPRLPDGRRTLILVADNNFSPGQRSQVLALAIDQDERSPR